MISPHKFRMVAQAMVVLFVLLSLSHALALTSPPHPVILALASFATLWLMTCRTTWLPFLGPSAFPIGILKPRAPHGHTVTASVTAPHDAIKAVFWASEKHSTNPFDAYGAYTNAGVAEVVDGTAILRVRKPFPYEVHGKTIAPHIHYRWVSKTGMLSGIRTVFLDQ